MLNIFLTAKIYTRMSFIKTVL